MKVMFLCQTLSCTWQRTLVYLQFTVNSLLFVYSFFSHLSLFLRQFLSILFSGRKRLKTRKAKKSSKHNDVKTIQAERMKTKLRMAFQNLVKLKSLRDKKWKYLEEGQDEIVLYFFLAEMFALEWQSGAKKFGCDVNYHCHFWRKGFNRFELSIKNVFSNYGESLSTCFQIVGV